MTYKIDIKGMHCLGCQNLIKISLEEVNFRDTVVSMEGASATFNSPQDLAKVKQSLDSIFAALGEYSYSNLALV